MTTETQRAYEAARATVEHISTALDAAAEEVAALQRVVRRAEECKAELETDLAIAINERRAAALEIQTERISPCLPKPTSAKSRSAYLPN